MNVVTVSVWCLSVLLAELVLLQLDFINPEARRVEASQHLHQVGQPRVLSQIFPSS